MATWEHTSNLVRLVVVVGTLVSVPFIRRWAGGRLRTYLIVAGGLVSMIVSEGLAILEPSLAPALRPTNVLWAAVGTQAVGYMAVLLGILVWIRDLREARNKLQRSNQALQEVAATDFLTGLLSRRQASFLMDFEAARARRKGSPLGFIMMDLDHFKAINDTHGHQAGDAVLAHVGRLLKSRLRASDIVARYGGEEFLVVTQEADRARTIELAHALRLLVEQNPAPCGDAQIAVRASFGVAVGRVDRDDTPMEAIARADAALYAAKARGRNRVVVWEELAQGVGEPAAQGAAQN